MGYDMRYKNRIALPVAVTFVMVLFACDKEQDKTTKPAASSTAKEAGAKTLDPRLQRSIASAAANGAKATGAADQPPTAGIFAAGVADKLQPKSAEPKITVLDEGSGPKVVLRPTLDPKARMEFSLRAVKRAGRTQTPAVRMNFEAKVELPKEDDETQGSGSKARPLLVAKVVSIGNEDKSKLPEKAAKAIEKLVGSEIRAELSQAGTPRNIRYKVPPKAKAVADLMKPIVEAMELVFSPMPAKAVGVGARWIANDRGLVQGMDVLRYRVTKIVKMAGDDVAFAVDVRSYAAGPETMPAGLDRGQGLRMMAFESFGRVVYTRKATALAPTSGELKLPFSAQIGRGGKGPAGQMRAELEARVQAIKAK
jgi:hypothetical protein